MALPNNFGAIEVTWYWKIEHQRVPYEDGKMCLYTPGSGKAHQVLCEMKYGLNCVARWYLAVNMFDRYSDGHCYKRTPEGLMYVDPAMQRLEVSLISLGSRAALIPLIAAHSMSRIVLVHEI